MSIGTIIILSITAGVHVIGLALFFFWVAIGSPMSIAKFKDKLKQQFVPGKGRTRREPAKGSEL
jgi:hypothetical protein